MALPNDHPIGLWLLGRLAVDGKTSGHSIQKKLAQELLAKLRALFGSEELRVAVASLLALASALDAKDSPKAGKSLCALLESKEILDALCAMNEARGQKIAVARLSGKDKLARFLGEGSAASNAAAKTTEKSESMKLDRLKFPKKI